MRFLTKSLHKILLAAAIPLVVVAVFGIQQINRMPPQIPQIELPTIQEIVDGEPSQSPLGVNLSNPVLPETAAAMSVQPSPAEIHPSRTESEVITTLEEIKTQLEQQNDAFLYFDDRLEPFSKLMPELESAIALQSSIAELLEQRLSNLEIQVSDIAQKMNDDNTASLEDSGRDPPFHLIAIDRWNNEWNAVVQLNGKISMIGKHASLVGWMLVEVYPEEQAALFRGDAGEEVKLKVSS